MPEKTRVDDKTKIEELIDRWEDARENGQSISPEELCRDRPDLLPAIEQEIHKRDWLPPWVESEDDHCQMACGAMASSQRQANHRHSVSDKFGQYTLGVFVGAGGYGEVWRAFDPKLKRVVAIKIMPRGERSLDEALKVARLQCPGVVPVHDVGRENEWDYIVSDLIDGPSLAEVIGRKKLSKDAAVKIGAAVANTLDYVHLQRLVHRDVKPGNILLNKEGAVYLADFGIAITPARPLDEAESLRGTLVYMSPEQIRGDGRLIDRRSDIYSLGAVLFEMLTGRRPFQGDVATLRKQILEADPPRPRSLEAGIPAELEAICLKCLEKDPNLRHPTARDLADKLQLVLQVGIMKRISELPLTKFLREWAPAQEWDPESYRSAKNFDALAALLSSFEDLTG